ncbi:DUF2061 domain-containing protein [Asticcacaulis sp. YBE204]|uniref:DUF2061 domain-containing protein n=1 Tax=Asticcacaulis sp. YBE204 TaxID=1282363 RepID=UPI0003C406C9|nr:DUF2061 domain-containing protein [Asticcacaulis sp. YBE204]ESQ77969.1 hypothetical protein AEYBE204_15855 [Asticcacaulis sp. YBE204]
MRLLFKTLTYGVLHVGVATGVAYVLTGNLAISLGIGLLEPCVQTLVFPLHEYLWERKSGRIQWFHKH